MLILLSPAKKLLQSVEAYQDKTEQPLFLKKTQLLVQLMQSKSVDEIAALMDLSPELATLNFERYQEFSCDNQGLHSYPALFIFQGDVYQGLQASTWSQKTVNYSQDHLRILSGLYGLLNPLDEIQPYRLEMGVRLANSCGKNLYDFWQETITQELNRQLDKQDNPILINLASTEYFKSINEKKINHHISTINFYEHKNDQLKMIGIYAKKARGVMARFLMENQIDDLEHIKEFNLLGYTYNKATSTTAHLDFIRHH